MLAATPSLARLFARAALTARGRGGSLPGTALRLESARSTVTGCCAYQRMCGFAGETCCRTPTRTCSASRSRWRSWPTARFPLPCRGWSTSRTASPSHRRAHGRRPPGPHGARRGPARPHPKGRLVDLVTEVDVAGERVWERPQHLPAPGGEPTRPGRGPSRLAAAASQDPAGAHPRPRGTGAGVCRGGAAT